MKEGTEEKLTDPKPLKCFAKFSNFMEQNSFNLRNISKLKMKANFQESNAG